MFCFAARYPGAVLTLLRSAIIPRLLNFEVAGIQQRPSPFRATTSQIDAADIHPDGRAHFRLLRGHEFYLLLTRRTCRPKRVRRLVHATYGRCATGMHARQIRAILVTCPPSTVLAVWTRNAPIEHIRLSVTGD
jgi:hypothetical protein